MSLKFIQKNLIQILIEKYAIEVIHLNIVNLFFLQILNKF
jgi:hypothetical protein